MKKLNVLFTAAALLFVLGCKNNAAPAKVENTDGSYIQVSIDNSKVTDSSRTAISAVPENVSYVVTASSTTDSETVSASSPIEQGSLVYNLQVTPGKTYKVEVTGYKNQSEVYKGSGSLSVPVSGKYGITVTVEYLTEGTGSVNLKFDVSDTSVYEIEKLVISGTGLPELDKEWEADNGTITVSASAVACGDYEVVLSFCNSSDVIVVEIPERISVRKNLSSSVWVKAGNQIYLKEVEGKQLFVLTDSLIKSIIESTVYVNAEGGSYTGGVIKTASDANAGTWAEPLLTLQEAVNRILAINDGVSEYTIYFSGTDKCKVNGNLTSFEDFSFINISSNKSLNLSIIGDNVENCIINADRSESKTGRVLYAFGLGEKFNLTLKNLQITGGYLKNDGENDYTGGGIRYIGRHDASALNNNLKIYNSKIYGNTAESGAGIYCTKNVIIGNNTSIYSNTSELNGGGIYYQNLSLDNGKLIIGETSADAINIYENKAASGGGIYCDNSYLELNKANIYKNEASENGGGLYIYGSSAFVMNDGLIKENKTTVIFANKGYGGGVFIENDKPDSLFDMCGGTIKENTVSGVSGKGVYIGGAKGNCCVSKAASILDEVFLPQNVSLYVKDELSGSAGINVTYTDYNSTKKPVIMRETGVTSLITYALCSKFNILNDGGKYCLEPVSLTEGGLKTAGGVVEKGAKTSSVSYEFVEYTLKADRNKFRQNVENQISFTVEKNGSQLSTAELLSLGASYSMKLFYCGKEIPAVTSSTNSLTLPDWLPEGSYQVWMEVVINSIAFDKTVTIIINNLRNVLELSEPPVRGTFEVSSDEGLLKLSSWSENNHCQFENCTFILTEDITIENVQGWKPLGVKDHTVTNFGFRGTLDGGGHTINIKTPLTFYDEGPAPSGDDNGYYGEFYAGIVNNNYGVIKNIVFYTEEYADTTDNYFNCLARQFSTNCWWGRIGGIAATNYGTIKNCWNRVNIYSPLCKGFGGIAGENYGTIINCVNTGKIKSTNAATNWTRVGGIAGVSWDNEYDAHIINCVNYGIITRNASAVVIVPGAILGYQEEKNETPVASTRTIKNCYYLQNCISYSSTKNADMLVCIPDSIPTGYTNGMGASYKQNGDLSITGCGNFDSSYVITAGTASNSYVSQTLEYGTNLLNALNGYVSAHGGEGLCTWAAEADGRPVLSFE